MRIRVTIGAFAECDSRVARFAVRSGRMTLLASNLCVQPSQRVARLRVVKLSHADRLPIVVAVTLEAVLAQPSLVLVLVTGDAARGNAQECFIQIFDFDGPTLGLGDMFSSVTTIAGQPRVFALQWISRLLVAEGARVPLD